MKGSTSAAEDDGRWLTTAETARIFRVRHTSVNRWVANGRIPEGEFIRTPGGRCRIKKSWVMAQVNGGTGQ